MPKIVRFYEIGEPEVLKIEEVPLENPGPGEVRLRVEASVSIVLRCSTAGGYIRCSARLFLLASEKRQQG